jgi:hypothetical protein
MSYNPWDKKNPFLSVWLSGANAVFGATRSHMLAAARRHSNAAVNRGTQQLLALWGLNCWPKSTAKRRRRR